MTEQVPAGGDGFDLSCSFPTFFVLFYLRGVEVGLAGSQLWTPAVQDVFEEQYWKDTLAFTSAKKLLVFLCFQKKAEP